VDHLGIQMPYRVSYGLHQGNFKLFPPASSIVTPTDYSLK
jgi:hypothetical protein